MRNVLMAAAAVLMLGGAAPAFADEAKQPIVLSDAQLDETRGGAFGDNVYTPRIIDLGRYSVVFDGTTWKIVWK